MRALLLGLCLVGFAGASLPSTVAADPCRAHCRDKARACKRHCKRNHPEGASPSRHRCLETCEMHEADCRARC
jgi:hypothetical protein